MIHFNLHCFSSRQFLLRNLPQFKNLSLVMAQDYVALRILNLQGEPHRYGIHEAVPNLVQHVGDVSSLAVR